MNYAGKNPHPIVNIFSVMQKRSSITHFKAVKYATGEAGKLVTPTKSDTKGFFFLLLSLGRIMPC